MRSGKKEKPMKRFCFLLLVGCVVAPWVSANTISGRVHDYLDCPIVGVRVEVRQNDQVVATASTDSTGSYSISAPEGTYTLRAEKEGYSPRENRPRNPDIYLEAAGTLTGKVTRFDGVTPIVGASIRLRSKSDPKSFGFGKTDSQGQYRIQHIDPGTYSIEAYHSDFQFDKFKSNFEITGPAGPLDFRALVFGKIAGQVSYNQIPMAGVLIKAQLNSEPTKHYYDFSHADGSYRMTEVPPGIYTVSAEIRNYEFTPIADVVVEDAVLTDNVNFTPSISANGTLSGRITRSDGATPIEGLSVQCEDVADPQLYGSAMTDSAGLYEIEGLRTGVYNLSVHLTGSIQRLKQANISVTDGSVTTVNLSTLDGAIFGTVTDNAGNPLPNATVEAVATIRSRFWTKTDASGGYRVEFLPAGVYTLSVRTEDNWIPQSVSGVVVGANQAVSGPDFTLQVGGQISGTVTDAFGPIHKADVMAMSGLFWIHSSCAESSEDGTFTVSGLPSGSYMLIVKAEGHVSTSIKGISVVVGQTTAGPDFVLDTFGGGISGTVFADDGITPLAGALVFCTGQEGSFAHAMTNEDGQYDLPLLLPGSYVVSAFHEGYKLGILESVVVTGQQQTPDNHFILQKAGAVEKALRFLFSPR
jgi:large repetitive protein